MGRKKILIVDDDRFFSEILKDCLKDHYDIFETTRGDEAVSLTDSIQPQMILLDIEMPGTNGIEICKQLKSSQKTRHIPVVLISSRTKKTDIVLGLQAGADDYFTKPLNQLDVQARIDAHLKSNNFYPDLEHRDLVMLLELFEAISVMRNPMNILRLIVERLPEVMDISRCSIVGINTRGDLTVKASSDMDYNQEIRLEKYRYPEISTALETGRAVIVNDIKNDPIMAPVREYISGLDFQSVVVVPIIKKQSTIGTFFLRTASDVSISESDRIYKLCHIVANISANALENATLFESMRTAQEFLEEMAIRDGLTKLYTHRHFYDRLDEEFSRAKRHGEPLSVIFCDIDDFKAVNDTHGHVHGDEVLREIARIIRGMVRESDIPARYGGEEFAVVLPNTPPEGALELSQRLHSTIGRMTFLGLKKTQVTVSIGVSTFTGENIKSSDQLVRLADWGVYKAKAEGKNRIVDASDISLLTKPLPQNSQHLQDPSHLE